MRSLFHPVRGHPPLRADFLHSQRQAAVFLSALHFPDRQRKSGNPFVNLRGRECTERQAQEAFTAASGKERKTIGEVQIVLRGSGAQRGGGGALRQCDRQEETAVR